MNRFVNYEEAQQRLDDQQLFVVRALTAVHRTMLHHASGKLQPEYPLDVRYFYEALVRAIANHFGYSLNSSNLAICRIKAENRPDLDIAPASHSPFVSSGLAESFVRVVEADSKPDGCEFDLGYACAIASEALDAQTLQYIREGHGRPSSAGDTHDQWLEGFTASGN